MDCILHCAVSYDGVFSAVEYLDETITDHAGDIADCIAPYQGEGVVSPYLDSPILLVF